MTLARDLHAAVAALLRQVAEQAILPRFQTLATGDIDEKSPGELVTVADREAEILLADALTKLLPDARVVGEEACSADARLLERLDRGLIWIVDPIDGTANFARGAEPFGTMIALAREGEVVGGWIYAPLAGTLHFAFASAGAFTASPDGTERPLTTCEATGRPIATLGTLYMPSDEAEAVTSAAREHFDLAPVPRCAAAHYPRLCDGTYQIALFRRTLPWDHAAGALLLTEAGGRVTRWDGSPYHFHDRRVGILAASNTVLWTQARNVLINRVKFVTV